MGFWRSLGLGLWISKDEAWWIDLIGGLKEILVHELGKERRILEMDGGIMKGIH